MPTFLPIDLPPGIAANGTPYQTRGRWRSGDRVRWHNGALRPIGGWERVPTTTGQIDQVLTDPANERARAVIGWRTNSGTTRYAVGYNKGVKAFGLAVNTVYDITPAGFIDRDFDIDSSDGYGEFFYGLSTYGTVRPYDYDALNVFNWCFRTWGENLLMAERGAPSALYEWDAVFGNVGTKLSNAPEDFDCFHVTDERIVMVAGSPTEPRLIQWSDVENNNEWTPTVENLAGFQTLPGVGRFREIVTVQGQYLILSETDAYVARYVKPPYVYGFEKVSDSCGVESGAAVLVTEDFAMWPSARTFFMFDGNTVREVPCDVMDLLSATANQPTQQKIVGFVNPEWTELWWLFQGGSEEVDSYITYDWVEKEWSIGTLPRTAAGGHPTMNGPVMIGSDGHAYAHERASITPYDASPSEIYAESAPIDLDNGNNMVFVDRLLTDVITTGAANVTIIGQDVPNGPEITFGPYTISYPPSTNNGTPVRARGRQIRLRIESAGGDFIVGANRAAGKAKGHR